MIVQYSSSDGLTLVEPEDFRNFKLVLRGATEDRSPSIVGITFVDERNALISIELVPTLPGRSDGESWQKGYFAMIEAARKHGWIDAQTGAIRAHVERSA
ncbi:hypothetical protein KIP88_02120 [Bradyrhizobium sp. SRL28]|uniref:hypothetical protein n=1 Tax=Bradyrhizobium sp. SRL28 TaxID=2836178 RepID=UPI001BDE0C03|nr:hypothetical protein [Bradyrhizobium sp. SRL28]MBT1509287.1 hypothetical protein [Bradyrhizobium sp. SRL28]